MRQEWKSRRKGAGKSDRTDLEHREDGGERDMEAEEDGKEKETIWRFRFDLHEPNLNGFREVTQSGDEIKSEPDLLSDILKICLIYKLYKKNFYMI